MFKHNAIQQTQDILKVQGIEIPNDQMQIIINGIDRKLTIKFKNTNQSLTIIGLKQHDIESVLKAKKVLLENKNVKNIIFDIPCISLNEYEQIQQQYETEKERKLQTLVRIGGVKQTYDIQSQKDLYANKFLQFITKEDLEFFNDTVLEKNKQAFRTSDTQRTVFVPHNLIAKAEPIYSLLYYIIKTENKSHTNVNVVLGQQNKEKNIIKLALQFEMKQVQKIFEQVRLEFLQNQLNWVHQVGNRGCLFCNDDIDNNDGPNTSEELLKNHQEYNIQNTGFFVTSILNTMASNPSDKNFLAYTYKDNTYDIINSIIELTQDYEQMVNQNNENMKEFLQKEKKFEQKKIKQEQFQNMLHSELKSNLLDQLEVENDEKLIDDIISGGNQDEFVNKLAIFSVLLKQKLIQLPGQIVDKESLYLELYDEYHKMINVKSFTKKDIVKDSNCYCSKLLYEIK